MIKRQVIHDTIAELLGLSLNRVINAYSMGGRIDETHAMLRYFNQTREVLPETRLLDNDGNAQVRIIWNTTLEVQLFMNCGNATDKLRSLINQLDLYAIDNRFKANDVVIVEIGPIRDLTTLLDDKRWESRAVVEITLRFTDTVDDKLDLIENVEITGVAGNVDVNTGMIRKEKMNG